MNYKMIISYDGTRYRGWEHQPGTEWTIQGKLETVLNKMLEGEASCDSAVSPSLPPSPVEVIGAGRTDAGVHARAMTANVVLNTTKSPEQIQEYMNSYLPDDISVNELKEASPRFHSRYNALGKTYRYTLWYSSTKSKPLFDRRYVTVLEQQPDLDRMKQAASYLCGTHDFRSFCKNPRMKKSTVRCVDTIRLETSGHYIRIYFHGNGFLQGMVRIITGTLLECGYGRLEPDDMLQILNARDRKQAGPTAPPCGLCLMKVDY